MIPALISDQVVSLAEVPPPVPAQHELLVEVQAAGMNRADLARGAGRYHQDGLQRRGPAVAGLACAGTVVAAGASAVGFQVGDRVMGMRAGTFAELAGLAARIALSVPSTLSWPEAAAVPVAAMTDDDALLRAELTPGESVLIHGAASDIGLFGVQLTRACGSSVYATARRQDARRLLVDLGAKPPALNSSRGARRLRRRVGRGVDVVLDHLGSAEALAAGGRLISIGRTAHRVVRLDLERLAHERLSVLGVSFRSRTINKIAVIARLIADVVPVVRARALRPSVACCFVSKQLPNAYAQLEVGGHLGKIVLTNNN